MKRVFYIKNVQNIDPKKFTNTQLRYVFKRILKRIKDKPRGYFTFKRLRGYQGICNWEEGISVDPRKELVPTIIHEVIHDLYPKNWEGWILRLESKIVNILKPYDIYLLLNAFFCKLDIGVKKKAAKKKRVKRKSRF